MIQMKGLVMIQNKYIYIYIIDKTYFILGTDFFMILI